MYSTYQSRFTFPLSLSFWPITMPPPNPLPKYIWKILDSDPSPLPEGLPLSDLDRGDGFIHLSTPEQVELGPELPRVKAPER